MTSPRVRRNTESDALVLPLRWQRCRVTVYAFLLPVHLLLLAWLACRYSPTADEPAHLAAGVRILSTGEYNLYPVNPPLVKTAAALPVVLNGAQVSWRRLDVRPGVRSEWVVGLDLMQINGKQSRWMLVIARWACLPFAALGLIYCWRWGAEVVGPVAGLAAATIWTFSPNVLGNGCLLTPDVAATSLGLATMFYTRHWLLYGRWSSVFLAGLFLGLAQLAKMTSVLWYPIIAILFAVAFCSQWRASAHSISANDDLPKPPKRSTQIAQLAVIIVMSLSLLNLGYGFKGSLQPLGKLEFLSKSFAGDSFNPATDGRTGNRYRDTWLGALPMPFPSDYLAGLDLQRRDFEGGWRPLWSYRAGEHRIGGWWDFYLYGILVKTPCGLWVIAIALLASLFLGQTRIVQNSFLEWSLLIVPASAIFLAASSQTGFSRSFRYVLPCFPFAFVLLGSAFAAISPRWPQRLAQFGLGSFLAASLWIYPHSLAFFNLASGGPMQAHWHLLDSNLDWGQDLYFLHDWIRKNPDKPLAGLAISDATEPRLFGVDVPRLSRGGPDGEQTRPPGWYAVSANFLHGFDTSSGPWHEFLNRQPADHAGYSILIYHVEGEPQ